MIISGQFNDSLAPIMDGVAITAQNYVYWLNKNHAPSFAIGPKVHNFKDTDSHILRYKSIPVQFSGPYRLGVPRIDRSFNKKIDLIPFDIVHAHCPFVSGNYAMSLSKKRKIPMVATFHSKYRDDFAKWLRIDSSLDQVVSMIVKFYEQADSVWIPNEAIIDTVREYGYKGPIDFVPNGSDLLLDDSEDLPQLKEEGLKILKCKHAIPVLLYVGQLRWVKNIRLIIESLKILADRNFQYQMIFVGNGSDSEKMQELSRKYSLDNRISFTGLVSDRDKLKRIYAASDLFVFPSLYDNASIATREAAGMKVPTIFIEGATTASGIIDNKNGYLSQNDSVLFADKIEKILSDPDNLKIVGSGAKDYLYVPWDKVARIVYGKYNEIIDQFKYNHLKKILINGDKDENSRIIY